MTWYNNSWNYRKAITISNFGSSLTDYQVSFTIDTVSLITAKMRSDCGDIRLTDSDGSTLLSYWIESGINSSSTKIWVKIPSIINGNNIIYLYYGNPIATSLSNGDNTFSFFDDFTGSIIDVTKWTGYSSADISISNSILTYHKNGSVGSATMSTITNFSSLSEVRARHKWTATGGGNSTDSRFGFEQTSNDRVTGEIDLNGYNKIQTGKAGVFTASTSNFDLNTWDILNFKWDKNTPKASFYKNDVEMTASPITNNIPIINLPVRLFVADNGFIYLDWIFVKNYAILEPTICIGEEVSIPSWLANWNRRKLITITGSTNTQTDYQMKLTVHKSTGTDTSTDIYLGNNVNNDFSDLRFTSSDGSTLLNHWIESYTSGTSAIVWIKIPSIPISPCTVTIYGYYNNSGASTSSNGNNTFEFFDDFSGNLSKWTSVGTTITSGRAIIGTTGTGWGNYLSSTSSFNRTNTGYILSYDLAVNGTTANYHETSHGFNSNTSGNSIHPSAYLYYGEQTQWNTAVYDSGTWISPGISAVPTAGIYYNYRIRINQTSGGLASWSGDATTINFTGADNNFYIKFNPYKGGCGVDNVIIRKYTSPEPTFLSIGTEEILTGSLRITSYPSGAGIWLASHGQTPSFQYKYTPDPIIDLVPGNYDIRLTKNNYEDWIFANATIFPGTETQISASLVLLTAHITATSLVITPSDPCISGSCTVWVDVIWTNTGGASGTFTPSIKVDNVTVITDPVLTPVSVGPSGTKSQQFVISGLTTGIHTICPDPN